MKKNKSTPFSYEVGYGRPPAEYRFKKGVSGNPEGRRKGTKNFATIFMKAMAKTVVITENGRRRRISKLDAAVTQLANDAARGGQESDPARLCFAAGPPTSDRGPKTGVFLRWRADAGRTYDLNVGDSP